MGDRLSWRSELFIFSGDDEEEIGRNISHFGKKLRERDIPLWEEAFRCFKEFRRKKRILTLVARNRDDLERKIQEAVRRLSKKEEIRERRGIYYFPDRVYGDKIAFLFPGEGSQYPGMLRDLALNFPEVRRSFDLLEEACNIPEEGFIPHLLIFPPPSYSTQTEEELWEIEGAIEAVMVTNFALARLLKSFQITPHIIVGHSTGECSAQWAGGIIQFEDDQELVRYTREGYRILKKISRSEDIPRISLLTVGGLERNLLYSLLRRYEGVYIALENCPHQVVIGGERKTMEEVFNLLVKEGGICSFLPFDRPYHTPLFKPALRFLRRYYEKLKFSPPQIPTFSCATTLPYPRSIPEIRKIALQQWVEPVRFQQTIENLYAEGIRIFLEVGPRGNLTGFVEDILRGRPHLTIPLDRMNRSGIEQLQHALGILLACGFPVELENLFKGVPSLHLKKPGREIRLSTSLPRLQVRTEILTPMDKVPPEPEEEILPDRVMEEYFRTMEKFLSSQRDILSAFLGERVPEPPKEKVPSEFPFVGEVVEYEEGRRVVVRKTLHLEEEIFLWDHTFGTEISVLDPTLKALPVMPLTSSVEVLAEVASLLAPGKKLLRMENIRAYRWITFEEGAREVEVHAFLKEKHPHLGIEVEMREIEDQKRTPLIRGQAIFQEDYPTPPSPKEFRLKNLKEKEVPRGGIYPGHLFHGKSFQLLKKVTAVGDDGLEAVVEVLPISNLFKSNPRPRFLTHPLLTDAMGSCFGIWSDYHLGRGESIFPFSIKSLKFYKDPPREGEEFLCQFRVKELRELSAISDIELLDAGERVVISIEGWEDRRFPELGNFFDFLLSPIDNFLSEFCEEEVKKISSRSKFTLAILKEFPPGFFEKYQGIWKKTLVYLILNREEREYWNSLKDSHEAFITHWLLGRAVAKDAVRYHIRREYGKLLGSADIFIENEDSGRPWAKVILEGEEKKFPLSISHTGNRAVALVGDNLKEPFIGVDMEKLEEVSEDFLKGAFSLEERRWFQEKGEINPERALRLWCAKEAVAKALGTGLKFSPQDLRVEGCSPESGEVEISLQGSWRENFPEFGGRNIRVYTFRREEFVVATCRLSKGGSNGR